MRNLSEAPTQAARDQRRWAGVPRFVSAVTVMATLCALILLLASDGKVMAQSGMQTGPAINSVEADHGSLTQMVTATHGGQPIGSATVTTQLSNDATLASLALTDVDIGTFDSGTTDYSAGVGYDVPSTTVTATANDDDASVTIADRNGVAYGTQYTASLSPGENSIRVTVTAEDGNTERVYTITISVDDHGDTRETATELQVGTPMDGDIGIVDDADFFKFELTQASNVIIQGSSERILGGFLYDSSGELIDRGSHSVLPHGRDSFFILERLEAGNYYVSARIESERIACIDFVGVGCGPSYIGPYTLSVTTVPEPGSTRATARPLTMGTISGGTIDPENDTDYFSITLTETTHVIVWAAHKYVPHIVDSDGTYREPIDVDGTLLDSNGNPVTANLREEQLNLPMGFYLRDTLAAGTHYLKVVVSGHRANYDRTGPYVLWAEEDTEYADFLNDCTGITTSYSDPLFGCQWHLDNTGQGLGTSGEDINVTDVWTGGNTGEGIVVAVVDDGVDPDHEDLNVNRDLSHDYQGEDQLVRPHETHGTQVAGIIAARDNSLGMRGVAPGATIYSYNFLAEGATLENAVDALTRNMNSTAVSNNSWGGASSYRYIPRPAFYDLALEAGVARGYGGKGVFYVFSAGNGAGTMGLLQP